MSRCQGPIFSPADIHCKASAQRASATALLNHLSGFAAHHIMHMQSDSVVVEHKLIMAARQTTLIACPRHTRLFECLWLTWVWGWQVIKRFIMHVKKTAFVVEHDFIMAAYLADRVIVYEGAPSKHATARTPQSLLTGDTMMLCPKNVIKR